MAEQEQHSLASTFPNPPLFWKDFTPDRISRIEKAREEYAENTGINLDSGESLPHRLPDVPEDLATLQPPLEPSDGRWRVFGDQYMLDDKLPTLEDQGITNLPATGPSNSKDVKPGDRALELKRLTKSLLLNFLELSGTLAQNPSHSEAKVQDIRTIFINIHHILNEYRPHQARESAIKMMEDHLDRTRAETVAIRTQLDKARRVMEGLSSLGAAHQDTKVNKETTEDDNQTTVNLQREGESWAAADALLAK